MGHPNIPFLLILHVWIVRGDSHSRGNLRSRDKVKVQTFSQRSGSVHTRGQFSLGRMFGNEFVAGQFKNNLYCIFVVHFCTILHSPCMIFRWALSGKCRVRCTYTTTGSEFSPKTRSAHKYRIGMGFFPWQMPWGPRHGFANFFPRGSSFPPVS